MKKGHIIGIIVIAVLIGAITSTIADSSTYATFTVALENPNDEFHVVGKLDKGNPVQYNPALNPNLTVFTMVDNEGKKCKVFLNKSKPQDFERSESIVLIGRGEGEEFYADEILMKCPSKYNEENKVSTALLQ